jgi:tape measure domain-containing protein
MTQEIESIGLGMDTSGVEKGIKSLETLASTGPKVEKAMQGVETATQKTGKTLATLGQGAGAGLDEVGKKSSTAADGLGKVSKSADEVNKSVKRAGSAGSSSGLDALKRSADSATTGVKSLGTSAAFADKGIRSVADAANFVAGALRTEAASLAGISTSLGAVNSAHALAAKNAAEFAAAVKLATEQSLRLAEVNRATASSLASVSDSAVKGSAGVRKLNEDNKGLATTLGSVKSLAAAVLGGAVVQGAMSASKAMFDASSSAERLRTMLDFATGGNGAKEIEYLRGVTERLGLQFSTTAVAYGQFQAAAKGTALEGEKARSVFESVAKSSAVMGLSADQTSGVLLALQQMISKGTVQAEELRGQLGERLPGAFQIAAKAMGVTTAELGKMLEQGQVVASDFLPKFGKALEENLGGAAEKAAQRLDAAVNRFDNAWTRLKQTAGDSGISKALGSEVEAITRDLAAVTDAMENARKAGGGMFAELATGGGVAAGRTAFSTLNLAANTLNGTINLLTGGLFGLRTDLALLPDAFKTNEQRAVALATDLKKAEAEFANLQKRGDTMGGNIYYKAEMANLAALIKELKSAQTERAKLAGEQTPSNMNAGVAASGRAREAYNNQRAKDEESANAFRLNQSGVPASYLKDMAELIRLNQAGVLVGKEYTDALKKQQDVLLQKTGVTKGSVTAASAEQNAYESLISSIRAKIEADKLELAGGAALTESQRLRIKLDQDLVAGRIKLGSAHEKSVRLALEELSASEAAALAAKTIAKANLDAAAAREKYITSLDNGLDKIRSDIQAQQEATARMGLSKQAIAALDTAKLEMLATDTELQAIKAMDRNLDQQTYDALKKQAAAYRELAKAKQDGAAKEASIDYEKASAEAAQKAQEDWRRAAEDINNSLTDALLRGFESGKDFAKNFRDTLVNMFKTLVLRPIISFIVNPISMAIGGIVNSGLSALGLGGNLLSGGGSVLGAIGSVGTAAAGWIGSGVGSIFGGAAGNAAIGGALGLGPGSSAAAAAAAAAAGGASTAGAGLGAFLGANALPILGGAIAAITMLARATRGEGGQFGVAFNGEADNNRRGQTYTYEGQQYDRDFSNGARNPLVDGQAYRLEGDPVRDESLIRQAVSGTAMGITEILKALGSSLTVTGFSAGLETSGKGRGGVFAGGTLSDGTTFGEDGTGDNYAGTLYELTSTNSPDYETALKNFTLDLKQSTIQALQAAGDIPESIKKMIEDVDAEALSDEAANAILTAINTQIVGVTQFKAALDAMGLPEFAAMTFDAAAAIGAAAGGFEALQASLASYYDNYYSEAEKTANTTRMVSEALAEVGLTMPTTREEFRAMVEAALAMGEAGAELVAVLLGVEDEFASITPKVLTLADAFAVSGDMIKGILDDAIENASSAEEASQMASEAFVDGMYASINDAMTSNLSGLIMGAIQPMVDAMIAGATTSGAAMAAGGAAGGGAVAAGGAAGGGAVAAGGAAAGSAVAAGGAVAGTIVASVIDQARASIAAWTAILSDPEIQGMIGTIGDLVGGVAGVAYEAGGAWSGGGGGDFVSPGSLGGPAGGAKELESALKSLGDTLEDEVKRLRGLMVEDSPFSKDVLLAQFATATAQARAGDEDALAKLPELSKAIEAASSVTAVSAVEMARTRGWLAGSLEDTLKALGLTGAGGVTPVIAPTTPGTTPTTPAPQVIAPVYNPAINGSTMDPALLAEVRGLRQDLAQLRTGDEQNHEEAQSMLLRVARSVERLEAATVLQS